jgi:hypothetical protein
MISHWSVIKPTPNAKLSISDNAGSVRITIVITAVVPGRAHLVAHLVGVMPVGALETTLLQTVETEVGVVAMDETTAAAEVVVMAIIFHTPGGKCRTGATRDERSGDARIEWC